MLSCSAIYIVLTLINVNRGDEWLQLIFFGNRFVWLNPIKCFIFRCNGIRSVILSKQLFFVWIRLDWTFDFIIIKLNRHWLSFLWKFNELYKTFHRSICLFEMPNADTINSRQLHCILLYGIVYRIFVKTLLMSIVYTCYLWVFHWLLLVACGNRNECLIIIIAVFYCLLLYFEQTIPE